MKKIRNIDEFTPVLNKIRPFTMVGLESLVDLALQVQHVLAHNIPGSFVECGVWRGGASFLIAELLRQAGVADRKVWLFDSFEGLPPPETIDGPAATAYSQNTNSPSYFNNCRASLEEVERIATELGLASYTEFVKGWFDQTLPANRDRVGPTALLRIDCDWYSSVQCCLDNLYDQVAERGFILLDDYYTWDGCAIAVHEFLGKRRLPDRIESVPSEGCYGYQSAVFRKGGFSWNWDYRVRLSARDIATLVQPETTFILVDQGTFRNEIAVEGRVLPFLERNGEYGGAPPDDETAIRELQRLRRQSAANLIIFAWPAFWWFEYYAGFNRHLRFNFPCILENERLVVFDLESKDKDQGPLVLSLEGS
jgi:O-methyltransferase